MNTVALLSDLSWEGVIKPVPFRGNWVASSIACAKPVLKVWKQIVRIGSLKWRLCGECILFFPSFFSSPCPLWSSVCRIFYNYMLVDQCKYSQEQKNVVLMEEENIWFLEMNQILMCNALNLSGSSTSGIHIVLKRYFHPLGYKTEENYSWHLMPESFHL